MRVTTHAQYVEKYKRKQPKPMDTIALMRKQRRVITKPVADSEPNLIAALFATKVKPKSD